MRICGGTLIQASHILTTATCVTNIWGEVIHPDAVKQANIILLDVFCGTSYL